MSGDDVDTTDASNDGAPEIRGDVTSYLAQLAPGVEVERVESTLFRTGFRYSAFGWEVSGALAGVLVGLSLATLLVLVTARALAGHRAGVVLARPAGAAPRRARLPARRWAHRPEATPPGKRAPHRGLGLPARGGRLVLVVTWRAGGYRVA